MPRLRADARLAVPLPETSDVVALPEGRFFVVSDKRGTAAIVHASGATSEVELPGVPKKKSSLEAVSFDPSRGRLRVFAEESRVLYAFRWTGADGDTPVLEREHELPFGDRKNKGVEGMVALDASTSPTKSPALLVANEGNPRALALLDEDALDASKARPVALDDALLAACADFSGLAFDRRRSGLLVVSDESASLALVSLSVDGGALVARTIDTFELTDERGRALERVEGVAVDDDGAWWVLLEDACELVRVSA